MKILCVCLGNICRSPTAEGILKTNLKERGMGEVLVDSAGTSAWHSGNSPDGRSSEHAKKRGYILEGASRQVNSSDFETFDLILAMDQANKTDLLEMAEDDEQISKVQLITDFCKVHSIHGVPDPYYKGDEGFEHVLDILEDACLQIVEKIEQGEKLVP